jgi:hypothetical protein
MDELTPLLTYATFQEGMSEQDWQREIEHLFCRQQAIAGLLDGTVEEDVVYDMLAEDDINPHEWVDAAIDNCEFLIGC